MHILLYFFCWLHPFYMGVLDVKVKNQTLQVTQRLFTQDIEKALRAQCNCVVNISNTQAPQNQTLLQQYISQHLSIKINQKNAPLTMLGYEVVEDAIWAYFEASITPKKINTLTIFNNPLAPEIPQQINIINLHIGTQNLSKQLSPNDNTWEIKL